MPTVTTEKKKTESIPEDPSAWVHPGPSGFLERFDALTIDSQMLLGLTVWIFLVVVLVETALLTGALHG